MALAGDPEKALELAQVRAGGRVFTVDRQQMKTGKRIELAPQKVLEEPKIIEQPGMFGTHPDLQLLGLFPRDEHQLAAVVDEVGGGQA